MPMKYQGTVTVRSTGGVPPSRGPRPGTVALADLIVKETGLRSGGIYNPRPIRVKGGNSTRWSTHADGRAIDIMTPVVKPDGDPDGNALAERLVASHVALGIQQIVWAGRSWRVGRGWRDLGSRSLEHYDHLHIEQTRDAADNLTAVEAASAFGVNLTAPSSYLRLGDESPWVNDLALLLGGPATARFSPKIERLVQEYQRVHGLQVDGIAGPQTFEHLMANNVGLAVETMYRTYLKRKPDQVGFAYWVNQITTGAKLVRAAALEIYALAAQEPTKEASEAKEALVPPSGPRNAPERRESALSAVEKLDRIAEILKG